MEFELDELQMKDLNKWKSRIKALYGEEGVFEYTFIPLGMGTNVKVYSQLTKLTLDISHVERW